jgi:hypothetical protein
MGSSNPIHGVKRKNCLYLGPIFLSIIDSNPILEGREIICNHSASSAIFIITLCDFFFAAVTFSRMDPEGKLIMGFRKASNSNAMQVKASIYF